MLREFISNRHITRQSIENRRAVRLSACSAGGIPFNFITPRYPRTGASKSWNEKLRTDQINGRPQYGTARFIDPVILCPIRLTFVIDRTPKAIFYADTAVLPSIQPASPHKRIQAACRMPRRTQLPASSHSVSTVHQKRTRVNKQDFVTGYGCFISLI